MTLTTWCGSRVEMSGRYHLWLLGWLRYIAKWRLKNVYWKERYNAQKNFVGAMVDQAQWGVWVWCGRVNVLLGHSKRRWPHYGATDEEFHAAMQQKAADEAKRRQQAVSNVSMSRREFVNRFGRN